MSANQYNGNGPTDGLDAYQHLVANSDLLLAVEGNLGNKVELYETEGSLMTIVLWDHRGNIADFMTQTRSVTGPRYEGYKRTLLDGQLQEMANMYRIEEDAS